MEAKPIEEVIAHYYAKLRDIPDHVHLLCPKVDPNDEEDYENVSENDHAKQKLIQEGKDRIQATTWCMLVYAMGKDKFEAERKELNERLNQWLQKCDKCIMNWHMHRKSFLREFAEWVALASP